MFPVEERLKNLLDRVANLEEQLFAGHPSDDAVFYGIVKDIVDAGSSKAYLKVVAYQPSVDSTGNLTWPDPKTYVDGLSDSYRYEKVYVDNLSDSSVLLKLMKWYFKKYDAIHYWTYKGAGDDVDKIRGSYITFADLNRTQWVKIGDATAIGGATDRWSYAWTQMDPDATGTFTAVSSGLTDTGTSWLAYNSAEANNPGATADPVGGDPVFPARLVKNLAGVWEVLFDTEGGAGGTEPCYKHFTGDDWIEVVNNIACDDGTIHHIGSGISITESYLAGVSEATADNVKTLTFTDRTIATDSKGHVTADTDNSTVNIDIPLGIDVQGANSCGGPQDVDVQISTMVFGDYLSVTQEGTDPGVTVDVCNTSVTVYTAFQLDGDGTHIQAKHQDIQVLDKGSESSFANIITLPPASITVAGATECGGDGGSTAGITEIEFGDYMTAAASGSTAAVEVCNDTVTVITDIRISDDGTEIQVKTRDIVVLHTSDESDWTNKIATTVCPA